MKVVWSRRAIRHLVHLREYIEKDSEQNAYIIPYRVRRERLELIAVFHGRQKWPAKL